ncbi:MAG: NTP transferase domain-containing protein, partial [Muribaculaceae bacterium]|nr:NTP transferase domain-containing protein [Muribaculaceae bacterium]
MSKRYAIIVAGGSGKRFGSEMPKQFLPLNGKAVLMRTIEKFDQAGATIVVVLP